MKIKNENDFLGFLISIKQENGNISASHILNKSNLTEFDCSYYLDILESKKYVKRMDLETYHICPSGINAYISKKKKFAICFRDFFLYILGLITPVVFEFIIDLVKCFLENM